MMTTDNTVIVGQHVKFDQVATNFGSCWEINRLQLLNLIYHYYFFFFARNISVFMLSELYKLLHVERLSCGGCKLPPSLPSPHLTPIAVTYQQCQCQKIAEVQVLDM